ncbi:hypothetical protein QOZ80_6BG0465610 [Eleusine coracana subsp. coracana]|nr:hypothetical protein QOZ80_6BG0465610 [Eleusine coracana subsp. coracana]
MSPSSDYTASILLCPEDSASVLGLEEEGSDEISGVIGLSLRHVDDSPGTLWIELPLQSDDCIEALLKREEEHMPMEGYAERLMQRPEGSDLVAVRRHAIDWIWKVREHYKFGPLTAVLSVNYLDRFLSVCDLPQAKAWTTQLLAVACLSLAAKMEETIVPHLLDLQVGEPNNDDAVSKIILSCSIDLILSTSKVAEFLVFRPSEVAASAALMALGKHENSELESVVTCCTHLRKERVLRCYEVLQENNFMANTTPRLAGSSVFVVPHSPIGVLDAATCESQQSQGTSAGAPMISADSSQARKRRKIGI